MALPDYTTQDAATYKANIDESFNTVMQETNGPLTHFSNLILVRNATTPLSKIDIDADIVVVRDTNGTPAWVAANLTADLSASGANGLDTGSEAASTGYYIWVIYNGTTVAGLFSTSSSAPTMPSGYTHKGLVGYIYNNSSSNFDAFYQRGYYVMTGEFLTSTSSSTPQSRTILEIPPEAVAIEGRLLVTAGGTAGLYNASIQNGSGSGEAHFLAMWVGNTNTVYGWYGRMHLRTANTIWIYSQNGNTMQASVDGYWWQ